MADMITHLMLDDVNLAVEEVHAKEAFAIAGYVNGRFDNWPAIVKRYGNSGKYLLSIDVQANSAAGAQALDVEKGDATPEQAAPWALATQAAGKHYRDLRWFPKIYVSESGAQDIVDRMTAAGFTRDEWRLWTAHIWQGGKPHICGPSTCGCPVQADATQYIWTYDGASLDASLCFDRFFDGPPPVAPPKPPAPVEVEVPNTVGLAVVKAVAALEAAGLKSSIPSTVAGVITVQAPKAGAKAPKGSTVVLIAEVPKAPPPVEVVVPNVVGLSASAGVVAIKTAGLMVADNSGGVVPAEGTITGQTPVGGSKAQKGAVVTVSVAPPKPVAPPPPPAPVVKVPEPSPSPVGPSKGKPAVLVYVQETLTAEFASKLGLPPGTILFIPHTVEGA